MLLRFLAMSPFYRNFLKSLFQVTCVQYLHSAWFLDGRTSILVILQTLIDNYCILK